MFGSSMMDIAIGVVFIFLLLSILATTINEIVQSILSKRGKFLLRGIAMLLDDGANAGTNNGLVEKVYTHGQVYGLFDGPFDRDKPGNLPSYIPSANFAIALLDSVANWTVPPPVQDAAAVNGPVSFAAAANTVAGPVQATPATAALAAPAAGVTEDFKKAVKWLAANPTTEKVGKPLLSMTALAGNDATKLQKNVENWFNSGMDRVSGRYKHHTQTALFVIGLVLAVALNADMIGIVRQLSKDQTQRQAIVAAAESFKAPAEAKPQPQSTGDAAGTPPSSVTSAQPGSGSAANDPNSATNQNGNDASADPALANRIKTAKSAVDQIGNLGIPMGWPAGTPSASWRERATNCAKWIWHREMIIGWLLTAVAICLGAPFWFDTLNKIMVVRSTVKPQEKSGQEASKDKT